MIKKILLITICCLLLNLLFIEQSVGIIEKKEIDNLVTNLEPFEFFSNDQNISIDLKIRRINGIWQDENITEYQGFKLEFKLIIKTNRAYPLLFAVVSLPKSGAKPIFSYIQNSEYSSKRTTLFEADDTTVFFSWAPVLMPVTITCSFQALISETGINKLINSVASGLIDVTSERYDDAYDSMNVTAKKSPYPNTPEKPCGEAEGFTNTNYTFTSSTTDPYDSDLFYQFNWGDGTYSEWIGPISSAAIVAEHHSWKNEGTYYIRVRAKNVDDFTSDWSESHLISISRKVKITKPLNGLYIANSRKLNLPICIIIGKIDVTVSTPGMENVDYVEFYIDDIYQNSDDAEPFKWTWDNLSFGKSVIKSIAYDTSGIKEIDSINVWKFF